MKSAEGKLSQDVLQSTVNCFLTASLELCPSSSKESCKECVSLGVKGSIFLKQIMNTEAQWKPKVADNGKYAIGTFITFMFLMMSSLSLIEFLLCFLFTVVCVSCFLPFAFGLTRALP